MSGAIIVEDPESTLPPEVEAMREVVMVLQETNIESGKRKGVFERGERICGTFKSAKQEGR